MRNPLLIEAPSNLGLKEPIPGVEPGVKFFASAMAKENSAAIAGIKTTIHVETRKYDGIKRRRNHRKKCKQNK